MALLPVQRLASHIRVPGPCPVGSASYPATKNAAIMAQCLILCLPVGEMDGNPWLLTSAWSCPGCVDIEGVVQMEDLSFLPSFCFAFQIDENKKMNT